MNDLPHLAHHMLELFENELSEVRFGDLDQASLKVLADQVVDRRCEVAQARAVLDEARRRHDQACTELTRQAERALAHARIYAADMPKLQERLDALQPQPVKRKRRSKGAEVTVKPAKKAARKEGAEELPFETRVAS